MLKCFRLTSFLQYLLYGVVLLFAIIVALVASFPVASAVPVLDECDKTEVMSSDEIKDWKGTYKTDESMEESILSFYEKDKNNKVRRVLPVHRNIAMTMARLLRVKDEEPRFKLLADDLYHWESRKDPIPIPKGEIGRSVEIGRSLVKDDMRKLVPKGYKLYLQLRINQKWKDWVYIATSERKGGKGEDIYGLFAAHDFPSNTLIGGYCGECVWRSTFTGNGEPNEEDTMNLGGRDLTYALTYRDKNAKMIVVVPDAIRDVESNSRERVQLYMGMHYMNNPCFFTQDGTKAQKDAVDAINTVFVEDGTVKTLKKISPGEELLVGYGFHENKYYSIGENKKSAAEPAKGLFESSDEDNDESKKPAAKKLLQSSDENEEDDGDEDYRPEEEEKSSKRMRKT
jgi:hypothetical protein